MRRIWNRMGQVPAGTSAMGFSKYHVHLWLRTDGTWGTQHTARTWHITDGTCGIQHTARTWRAADNGHVAQPVAFGVQRPAAAAARGVYAEQVQVPTRQGTRVRRTRCARAHAPAQRAGQGGAHVAPEAPPRGTIAIYSSRNVADRRVSEHHICAVDASGSRAHPAHICAGTGLTPRASAPGLGLPRAHLRRDCAGADHAQARPRGVPFLVCRVRRP